jgi:biopolymer transport protein ExbD
MGMSAGSPGREINVTPLIDILLVLLVIFLVTMPLVMRMESIDVPRKDDSVQPEAAIAVMVHADLTVSIDDGPALAESDLPSALRPHFAMSHATSPAARGNVFVGFDDGVPWKEAVSVVDTIRAMDDVHVALRTKD